MRTDLSAALQAAHAAPVQKPAWLVEIGFSSPVRLSSHAQVTFGGYDWLAHGVDVSGVRVGGSAVTGQIKLPNADNLYGAAVLNEGVSDRAIRIWGYDAAATASADFVQLVDGVGGRVRIGAEFVTIDVRDGKALVYAPRLRVGMPAAGITRRLPAGALIAINGATYRIERQ